MYQFIALSVKSEFNTKRLVIKMLTAGHVEHDLSVNQGAGSVGRYGDGGGDVETQSSEISQQVLLL